MMQHANIGVKLREGSSIRRMFVNADDFGESSLFEAGYEVLPDKSRRAGNDDFLGHRGKCCLILCCGEGFSNGICYSILKRFRGHHRLQNEDCFLQLIQGNTFAVAVGGLHVSGAEDHDVFRQIGEEACLRSKWDGGCGTSC